MKIKKYLAKSMREALMQIKEELGEEAIILKTRKIPKKVFGIGAADEIEVTAAIDDTTVVNNAPVNPIKVANPGVYAHPRGSSTLSSHDFPNVLQQVKPWSPPVKNSVPLKSNTHGSPKRDNQTSILEEKREKLRIIELEEEVRELKELVNDVLKKDPSSHNSKPDVFAGWDLFYKKLINSEVRGSLAESLIVEMKKIHSSENSGSISQREILVSLGRYLPVSGPLKLKKGAPLVVAFVGPTGSGKTTTLAKLAAHCCLNKQKSVSIITADTYRIAAIEQIRMFADIVKVGLQVVFSPDEVPQALEQCQKTDIIFVDTAGRSQKNREHMDDLKEFLSVLKPDETHLVLSATTKDSDLTDTVRRYQHCNINRLLFTKLDETSCIGNVFNLSCQAKIPVSYFTFGQSVPDDIELARPASFIERLWEGGRGE